MVNNTVAKKTIDGRGNGLLARISRNIEVWKSANRQNKGDNEDRGGHYKWSEKKTADIARTCTEDARSSIAETSLGVVTIWE